MAAVLSASRPQTMQIPSIVASSSTAIGRLRLGESTFSALNFGITQCSCVKSFEYKISKREVGKR